MSLWDFPNARGRANPTYGLRCCRQGIEMKKLLAPAIVAAAVAAIAIPRIVRFFRADSCLDSGGRWNAESKNCEH